MTVDVKGNSPLWLKVKDLAEGMTYRFRIRAKTFTYGPEIEANVTTGPGEGRGASAGLGPAPSTHGIQPPTREGVSRHREEQDGVLGQGTADTGRHTAPREHSVGLCSALMEPREKVAGLSGHPSHRSVSGCR